MNQSTLKYLNFLILIFAFQGYCQNQANDYETDYIKDLNGIRLNCKVVKIKNGRLTYRLYKKSQPFKLNLMNLTDLYISNNNFIDSPIGTEIKEPKDGFSHIYIYCASSDSSRLFRSDITFLIAFLIRYTFSSMSSREPAIDFIGHDR